MILVFILTVLSLVYWLGEETVTAKYSTCFFSFLIAIYYIFVFEISVNNENRKLLRDISYANFGTYVIITFVALIVISSGEVLEGVFDGIGGGSVEGKNKKINK